MDYRGALDKENRTVTFHGDDLDLGTLADFLSWLNAVRRWMEKEQEQEDGGRRWEIRRGTPPTASFMVGKIRWGHEVPLVPTTPRKPRRCVACGRLIAPRSRAWKQQPNSWAGHSQDRWCDPCVVRGGPPIPPKLTVIRGGAA